jgi:tetratricopeptide (TPR) repeat protein
MPKSPAEHKIERRSRVAFEAVLGDRFVFRSEDPDYKVDGSVEEIDSRDNLTGRRFFVQLKATEEQDLDKALALSGIPLEVRAYYRALPAPVLWVRYHRPTDTIYTRWVHQYDPYYGGRGEKTFTFRWERSDAWDDSRPDQLVADTKAFMELHSPRLPLPRPFHVVTNGALGLSQTELLFALRAAAERVPDLIEVRSGEPTDGAAWIELTGDELKANLAKVTATVLHIEDGYDAGPNGEQLAVDALVLAAAAFANVGQFQIASRLVAAFSPESSFLGSVDGAFSLQSIMAQARRVRESLEVATKLDQSDDPGLRRASVFFTMPAIYHGRTLSDSEFAEHQRTLEARIDRRTAAGDAIEASREMVSLANFFRSRRVWDRAIALYEEAAECDPGYRDRAHYWFEFGGVLFFARRYSESADAYARAIELGAEPIALALHADALLFAGEYQRAQEIFAGFNAEHPELAAEYRLKKIGLDAIVEREGITSQDRDTDAALKAGRELAGMTQEQALAVSRAQLAHDALWPSAWFNMGVAHNLQGDSKQALADFLAGSILIPEADLEVWRNAIVLALDLSERERLVDILTTARRLAGSALLKDLIAWSKEQQEASGFPREDFLAVVDSVLSESHQPYVPGFMMRIIDDEGQVSEIAVTDGGLVPRTPGKAADSNRAGGS